MEIWAWLGAYLVGFVLLQVYLYWYFVKRSSRSDSGGTAGLSKRGTLGADSEGDSGGAISVSEVDGRTDRGPPEGLDAEEAVRCGNCGAYNERDGMFVYCRFCSEEL